MNSYYVPLNCSIPNTGATEILLVDEIHSFVFVASLNSFHLKSINQSYTHSLTHSLTQSINQSIIQHLYSALSSLQLQGPRSEALTSPDPFVCVYFESVASPFGACTFRGVHPPETMMHFPPVSDFPPLSEKFSDFQNFFTILPFPEKFL